MSKPLRIIQISDIHIFNQRDQSLLGVKTQESFDAVVQLLRDNELGQMDAIILSGDLSQDGSAASYQYIANQLAGFNVPIYAIPGNHDDVAELLRCYATGPVSCEQLILFKAWQFILLNSHKPGSVAGELAPDQLQFLSHSLATAKAPNIIVLFHHHPVAVGSQWIDGIGLLNKDIFWETIATEQRIKAVVFGHIHQVFQTQYQNKLCLAPPSTCIQFKPNHDAFALDHQPPGYRWIALYEDGKIETGIKRTSAYVGEFQNDAKGY